MNSIPQHVAIIMDGNGRWGLKKKNSRIYGHKAGIGNIQKILDTAIKNKIKIITLFSFSFDNWKRNKDEINNIFSLFINFYKNRYKEIKNKNISLKIIGENRFLPKNILLIKKQINKTKHKNFLIKVNIALNYSSKLEIIQAIKKIKKINIKNLNKKLYTYPDPNPEIIIRTGNRKRLSDFLLWQSSYSEIFFVKKLWPDFNSKDFKNILNKYQNIKRNFGYAP